MGKRNKRKKDRRDKSRPRSSSSEKADVRTDSVTVKTKDAICNQPSRKRQRTEDVLLQETTSLAAENKSASFGEKQSDANPVDESGLFPFEVDADDHCETPLDAYRDVAPLFMKICEDKPTSLKIYDPYFCDGAVVRNLGDLGFTHVHNKKEDCYKVWSDPSSLPSFDALVTNPPYSGDNVKKLMEFITSTAFQKRPWFLLMPTWVHKKDYYLEMTKNIRPFYLVPRNRYVYLPPKGFRESKKSDVHKKSSPFVSMWYIWGGTQSQNEALIKLFGRLNDRDPVSCDLARSRSALRDLRRKRPK